MEKHLSNYGLGIIGCGLIGQKRAKALAPGQLKSVYDLRTENAKRIADTFPGCSVAHSCDDLLANQSIDIVIIATQNNALAPYGVRALEAGKHVLLEKPGAISLAQFSMLEEASHKANRTVRIGYNHRFHPALLKAYEIFRTGELGPLMFIRGRYGHGGRVGYDKEWRANPELSGGGELIDQGVHLIDLAQSFLGEFVHVGGSVRSCFWNMPVEDNAFIHLETKDQQTAWLHVSCSEWKNMFSLEIYGRNGKLHIEGLGGSYGIERLYHYKMLPEMGPPDTTIYEFPRGDQSWELELEQCFKDISNQQTPCPGLKEGRAVLEIVEKLYSTKECWRG